MAITVTAGVSTVFGNQRVATGTIALDSSYPTGGEALTAATLGVGSTVTFISIPPKSGYVFEYDYTNSKILAYYGDNNNASDGALIQVPNTTDLSSVTDIKFLAIGQ